MLTRLNASRLAVSRFSLRGRLLASAAAVNPYAEGGALPFDDIPNDLINRDIYLDGRTFSRHVNGTYSLIRIWNDDIGDAGIVGATS